MLQETSEYTSLGQLLCGSRLAKGLDVATVADQTKISAKILQAMEDDNYAALPAHAFARGFYALYARALDLEVDRVLKLYEQEQNITDRAANTSLPPFTENVGTMSERPSSLPFSLLGLMLLVLLLLAAFLSWYFSWNPATYFSQKLRSLETPILTAQVDGDPAQPTAFNRARALPNKVWATAPPPLTDDPTTVSSPDSAEESSWADTADTSPAATPARYVVNAEFPEETTVRLVVDNAPGQHFTAKEGETMSWQAAQKLILTLPTGSRARITLNDVPIDIPSSRQQFVTIAIPDSILR